MLVVLFQTVLKSSSLVGGLSALHTQKITMIKAGEVSQYGGLRNRTVNCTSNALVTCEKLSEMAEEKEFSRDTVVLRKLEFTSLLQFVLTLQLDVNLIATKEKKSFFLKK